MTEETDTESTEETGTEGTEETVLHRETEEQRKRGKIFFDQTIVFFSVRVSVAPFLCVIPFSP
jgi:hypothetical protein